jgi:hypothetical protein
MCRLSWTGLVHNREIIPFWYPAMGRLRSFVCEADLCSEDLKQFLDQLAVVSGCDDRIHTIAELHQAHPALVVHREADDSLQGSRPGVVQRHLDVG